MSVNITVFKKAILIFPFVEDHSYHVQILLCYDFLMGCCNFKCSHSKHSSFLWLVSQTWLCMLASITSLLISTTVHLPKKWTCATIYIIICWIVLRQRQNLQGKQVYVCETFKEYIFSCCWCICKREVVIIKRNGTRILTYCLSTVNKILYMSMAAQCGIEVEAFCWIQDDRHNYHF